MWNIFKKSNKVKVEQQRNLAVAHMRSSLEDTYKRSGNYDDSAYKSSNENALDGELPPGWSPTAERPLNWAPENFRYADDQHYWWEGATGRFDFDPSSQRSKLIKNNPWPKKYEVLPGWVEQYPGFRATAWRVDERSETNTVVVLVAYETTFSSDGVERPFAKIVFVEDNVPFKQMSSLCASVAKYNQEEVELHGGFVDKPYSMGMDGKIRDKTGEFLPDSHLVNCAIDDLYLPYVDWRRFPDVESPELASKLTAAWKDVEEMQLEEQNGGIKRRIEDIRRSIKASQDKIAALERDQNEMYEKAADALNILEEHGFDLKRIEEIQKKESGEREESTTNLAESLAINLHLPLKAFDSYNQGGATEQYALAP